MSSATYRLTRIHRDLDTAISHELRAKWPDTMRLLRLKKLRLAVKDKLTRLMRTAKA